MAHGDDVATIEQADSLEEEVKRMKILFRIAVQIKAGSLPESYSAKGTELANRYPGEELEEYAYGGY